jgi:hypothetical protein
MSKPLLIKGVTDLVAFEPAVKLQAISADSGNRYFRDYILTQDLADVYENMLSSVLGDEWGGTASTLPAERQRSHLITAQYGAGKSYFLMILSALLDAGGDTTRLQEAKKKFATFRNVQRLLGQLSDKKFLIIQVSAEDKGDIRFRELLVRSLLDQVTKVLPDAAFENEYTEAVDHLEEVESSPIGPAFAQVLDEQFDTSLRQLRARLGSYDRDGLRTYYQVCEQALGRKVSRDVLDVETTFQEALDLLSPKGYTHIAILIDELTAYLNASARHHSLAETLGELQAFAAHCNKPTSQCLFVGAMHVSVEEFLQDRSQQRDYVKMKGRFDEHFFPVYSGRLLAGVFRPKKDVFNRAMKSHHDQVKELTNLIETFQMTDDGRSMKLSAFFPLHPAVVYYLPRISRELGQAERTSFGFINEIVRQKLNEPLVEEQRLNLVTLDHVFEYFLPAMEQKEYYRQVITAYKTVRNKVSSPLAIRAFKPLVLLWIASRVRPTSDETQDLDIDLSGQQVADYLNVKDSIEVMEALESLRETGYVYFDASTQKHFYSHADPGWDLESKIQEAMGKVNPNEVLRSELEDLGPRVCLNAPDKVLVKVERGVESQWMDIEQLKQATSLDPKRAEGKIVFIVPDFAEAESYDAQLSDITLKARELSAANVAVAVPNRVDMLKPMELCRYRALQEIGKQLGVGERGSVNEHRVRLVRARFSEVRVRVQNAVEEFGQASNFIFFINRQPQAAQDLNTVLVDMFERYYYKFPKVKVESINGRNTTNALINSCIVNPQTTFASDTSEVARQTRDTLQVLGLCSWEKATGGKYNVELKEPQPGKEGYEIWKIVLDTLTHASGTPFATLYKRLEEAPYGLPDFMVELYIAAARALDKVYILDKSGTMPSISTGLVRDITRRKDGDYRVLPVQETEVPYTYICLVWQTIDKSLGLRHYQELEKNLGRTIDDQKTWFDLKADSNNLLKNRLSQVRENLSAIEAESAPFAILIKHLEQIRGIFPPAEGFEQLAALGEELSGAKISADPDAAALTVDQAVEASEQFLTDWAQLQIVHRQYVRLQQVTNLDRFGALAQEADKAWQTYRSDALSVEKRQTFVEQFEKLWERYAEHYVDEHNAVAKARTSYGKKVEKSLAYELVGEFSPFGFDGVITRSGFDKLIGEIRQQGCQPLAKDSVRDYEQFERTTCSSCRYRLGTDTEILAQLQENEASLVARVNNALDSYLVKLDEALKAESIQVYAKEKATAKEKTTIASIQHLADVGPQMSEAQHRELKTLLPQLRPTLSKAADYVREQAKKRKELERQLEEEERQKCIPRLPTTQLGDAVRSFLLDSGLEEMTLKELEERLMSWMQEIAKEFQAK